MGKARLTSEGWRCEKEKDHLYRPRWVDFQDPAIHLLTLVTTNRQPIFGALQGETIALTPVGELVAKEIENIPSYKQAGNIEIYRYVIMPDHIHILLRIHERLPKHLGQYIRWFKRMCTVCCQQLGVIPPSTHETLFAPEYHTRTLSGRGQLNHMARYIADNPRRLSLKRANPDLFRIRQDMRIGETSYAALGNIFLADHPQREALQCSRALTQAEIDALKDKCLNEAANGTVYVSAAISEGEKQICKALREAGCPLVVLLAEGFPEPDSPHYRYFKPQGVYFEACAAGKLLLLEPAAEAFERTDIEAKVFAKTGAIPHESKRYRFVALNQMAEEIAGGEGSAE